MHYLCTFSKCAFIMCFLVNVLHSLVSSETYTFSTDFNSGMPSRIALLGDAVNLSHSSGGVDNTGCLKLTVAGSVDSTSMVVLENITNEEIVREFDVSWDMKLFGGAYGLSFFFGEYATNILPSEGERGPDDITGVTVAFDTFYDSVTIKVNGEMKQFEFKSVSSSEFVPVRVQVKRGIGTVTYDNVIVLEDIELYRNEMLQSGIFGFAARSGSMTEDAFIDNLLINATTVQVTASPTWMPTYVYSSDFNCDPFSLNASQSASCFFTACARDDVKLSSCGCGGQVDYEVYMNGARISTSADSCGSCPMISFEASSDDYECDKYELKQQCISGSCIGTTYVTITPKCEEGWKLYDKSCFRVIDDVDYWNGKVACNDFGGHTATIESSNHNAWVARHFATPMSVRIGYNDIETESVWQWEAGNSDFSNFQDRTDIGDCAEVLQDGVWRIVNVLDRQRHLCQVQCTSCSNDETASSTPSKKIILLAVIIPVISLVIAIVAVYAYFTYSRRRKRDGSVSIAMQSIVVAEATPLETSPQVHFASSISTDHCTPLADVVALEELSQSNEICVFIPNAVVE